MAIGLTLTLLLALVLATLAPAASGQPSPAPSGSGSPSELPPGTLAVRLLNPNTTYDDPPKISDRFDGTDSSYTIVARTTGSAKNAIVEAYVAMKNDDGTFSNEHTIGQLERVARDSDVWELQWDIPPSHPEGDARVRVRAFVETAAGFVETGDDAVEANILHSDVTTPVVGAYETADLTWPEQDGPLGWYKPRVGAWRVVLSGTASTGATFVQMLVSTSPPGEPMKFSPCGSVATVEHPGGRRTFHGKCALSALVQPSMVTAVAALAELRHEATGVRLAHGADVSVVRPYHLSPEDMSVRIAPLTRRATVPAPACAEYAAVVTDENGQLVLGANVDIHAAGPTDTLILMSNGLYPPQEHATEQTPVCPGTSPLPQPPRTQADHNVPGGDDVKHMESGLGSGLDYLAEPPGQVVFRVVSNVAGFTELTAWVDDEEIRRETEQRPSDNDVLDEGEAVAHGRVQWMSSPVAVTLDPLGGTSAAGTCFPYTVKARSGTFAVPGINVDVHAVGPDDSLGFCDPAGGATRRAPAEAAASDHVAEDDGESHHPDSAGADAQHTEGETDAAGNLVVGLTSSEPGDSTVVAWIDGEPGEDDDVQTFGEATTSGTISWTRSLDEADLSFVNPSPYGGTTSGAGTGTQVPDSGGTVDVLVRVDMPGEVPGVEVLLSRDGRRTYDFLGEATRVGRTDLYALSWPVDVPDGIYGLRARIPGTSLVEDVDVKVGAGDRAPMTPNPAYEWLRLTRPELAEGAPFVRRSTVVAGRASAGAEGVEVYYTKVPAKDTPAAASWVFCGYASLPGTGTSSQDFSTPCTLSGSDQASQVTGIAAITFDCTVPGCDGYPFPPPPAAGAPAPPREPGEKDTGQALRVFGYEANPLLAIEPAETDGTAGECRRFEVELRDQTGQPIAGSNVDLHLEGAPPARFCRPDDASPTLRAPDAGGHGPVTGPGHAEAPHDASAGGPAHTEGETLADGSLVFGLTSDEAGDLRVSAWLDRNDDDVHDGGELSDTAILHLTAPARCSVDGTRGPDVLDGTPGDDVLCGLGGDDVIRGLGGDDVIVAGGGHDDLRGGAGEDVLRGGAGRDRLDGGDGSDECRGGPGPDRLLRCDRPRAAPVAPRRSGV